MAGSIQLMETQLKYCQFYQWKKVFITEARVKGESYFGINNFETLFLITIADSDFFCNIADLLL